MALTTYQRSVVRLLSANRIVAGESYVAGGAALNALLSAPRLSSDVDIFHDHEEAVTSAYLADEAALRAASHCVVVLRSHETFIEVEVSQGAESTRVQWSLDSAFRFFPLIEHPELGLALHPFDLATNKVLAMVGRAEPRDWVDVIECDWRLQPLGYLAWAASGKDPGLNPVFILEQAGRSARYTEIELTDLAFDGRRPTAAELSMAWHRILAEAREVVEELPAGQVGCCVLEAGLNLARFDARTLAENLRLGAIRYHAGQLGGAFPKIVGG